MALPSLSILLFLILLPTFSARTSKPLISRSKRTHPSNKGLSFSAPVYHRSRYIDRQPALNSTFSPSKAYTDIYPTHEKLLLMSVWIGSNNYGEPLLETELVIDTGSNLIWLQAQPCNHCYNQSVFSYYDSSDSATYKPVHCRDLICSYIPSADHQCQDQRWDSTEPCSYTVRYEDQTNSSGIIGTETFFFDGPPSTLWSTTTVRVENVPFGLGSSNYIPSHLMHNNSFPGIAGLMRGYGAILDKLEVKKFSHCFPRDEDNVGVLNFGDEVEFAGKKVTLIKESHYYMAPLTNVYVAGKQILRSYDSPHEMIFDTGSSLTHLEPQIMDAVIAAIKSALGRKYKPHQWSGYELCYDLISLCSISMDEVAKITFEFNYSTKMDLFSFHSMMTTWPCILITSIVRENSNIYHSTKLSIEQGILGFSSVKQAHHLYDKVSSKHVNRQTYKQSSDG